MPRLIYSPRAWRDLERITDFLIESSPELVSPALEAIADALEVLQRHPLIGRPAEHDLRELVISRGKTGYVALYEYIEADDQVLVWSIRHQLEAGFSG